MAVDAPISLHLSIHDVMPSTLDKVTDLTRKLEQYGLPRATLLVIPGAGWRPAERARLTRLVEAGHPLAGHGWTHQATRIDGPYHWLHSRLVSAQAAEHLCLDEHGVAALIHGCHAWFGAHDLPSPEHYVPPAWAMGRLPKERLAALPFRYYEFAQGIYDSHTERFFTVPVIGFEARGGRLRTLTLRVWNQLNQWSAPWMGGLRVAIHPDDDALALRDDLERVLAYWSERPALIPEWASA